MIKGSEGNKKHQRYHQKITYKLEYLSEFGSKLSLISATGFKLQTSLPRIENLSQPHAPAAAFQIKPVAAPAIFSAHPHL